MAACGNSFRMAARNSEEIRLAAEAGQVARPGMRDRHGGVVLEKKKRRGFSHDVAPAYDDGPRSLQRDALAPEQLEDAGRRAGDGRGLALQEPPGVHRVEPVDVFSGVDRLRSEEH